MCQAVEVILWDNRPTESVFPISLAGHQTIIYIPFSSSARSISKTPKQVQNESQNGECLSSFTAGKDSIWQKDFLYFCLSQEWLDESKPSERMKKMWSRVRKGKEGCSTSKNNLFIAEAIYQQEMVWCLHEVTNHSELFIWGNTPSCV